MASGPYDIRTAELLKFLRGVLEGARLRVMRGVFVVDILPLLSVMVSEPPDFPMASVAPR